MDKITMKRSLPFRKILLYQHIRTNKIVHPIKPLGKINGPVFVERRLDENSVEVDQFFFEAKIPNIRRLSFWKYIYVKIAYGE